MQQFASRDLMASYLPEKSDWQADGECGDCSNCTDNTGKPPDEEYAGADDLAALREQLRRQRPVT
jgi:hypothetical protein